jgi:hypothetical protein
MVGNKLNRPRIAYSSYAPSSIADDHYKSSTTVATLFCIHGSRGKKASASGDGSHAATAGRFN